MVKKNDFFDDLYRRRGIKPGLKRLKRLFGLFNIDKIPFEVIHIAGTNGKGTTASLCSRFLSACGKKTGLFLSPHLHDITERISIDGKRIKKRVLKIYIEEILKKASKKGDAVASKATFFELMTFASILYFIDNKIDWAVYETGMGGRLDATNILKGNICVITDISKDHVKFLGSRIEDIANEKFAIVKRGSVLVNMNGSRFLKKISGAFLNRAKEIYSYGSDFGSKSEIIGNLKRKILYRDKIHSVKRVFYTDNMFSAFERNLSCALFSSYIALKDEIDTEVYLNNAEKIIRAFRMPGRFEILNRNPYVIFDVSHNYSGVKQSVKSAKTLSGKNWLVIFGALNDKDARAMVRELKKLSCDFIIAEPLSDRKQSLDFLKSVMRTENCHFQEAQNIDEIFEIWDKKYNGKNVLVCGSFYFTGPLLKEYKKRKK